jgi:hypothetical protein
MSKIHVAWRTLGELLYPKRIIKHNGSANPKSVINKYAASYKKLLREMQVNDEIISEPGLGRPVEQPENSERTKHVEAEDIVIPFAKQEAAFTI